MRASEIAERALLGAILLDPARLADVQDWLEPADFYAYRHGLVYTEMLQLRRTGQEPTARAVLDRIIPSAESRRHVDGPYLHTLLEACPHPARAPIYGRMVLEASIHRRTADRAEHLGYVAQSGSSPDVVITELEREIASWTEAIQALEQRWTHAGGALHTAGEFDVGLGGVSPAAVTDEAAEVSVIASLLVSPWQFDQVRTWLRPDDFTRHDTRALYSAITEVAESSQPIDAVTVMWAAIGRSGATGGLDHQGVQRLAEAGVPGYAVVCGRMVLQASLRSQVSSVASRLASAAQQPRAGPAEVARFAMGQLAEVTAACSRWSSATA